MIKALKVTLVMAMGFVFAFGNVGCNRGSGARDAHLQAGRVAEDSQRITRMPAQASPKQAQAVMGRKPDAVHRDGDRLIHYYLVEGAVDGETLRLVFLDGRLIGKKVVRGRTGY